ncbi:ABC transporter substrate-binding protein [Paenibacillus sp. MY03]|uniref:ABC transporter substrate-binding protein n=1 Tax=Paenibacillus sp. MY03 TaxID=302980 RepID=UPI0015C5DD65|nr:ABC transporter substrate-binding protein [Paenibacillus sp. MY03]
MNTSIMRMFIKWRNHTMYTPARQKNGITLLVLLLTALMLAACGSNNAPAASPSPSPSQEASPTSSAETSPSAKSGTREYEDALGRKVEIPTRPERIIAHYYASEFTALGVPIVGTNYLNAQLVLTQDQLEGIEDIGGDGLVPNIEKVLALEPDLIVVPDFLEAADIDALAKVAPTVVVAYGADAFEHVREAADLAGKPELAEAWQKGYDEKVAKQREVVQAHIKQGETASAFVLYSDKKLYVYNKQRLGPTMYDAFGFQIPAKVTELFASDPSQLWAEISLEKLPEYVGDRIFLVGPGDDEESKKVLNEVLNGPVWSTLPAVKNNQAYIVGSRWAMNDPLSLEWLLDEMAAVLTAK